MGEFDCTLNPQYNAEGVEIGYCIDCPEVPAITAVPASVSVDYRLGWNSAARSILQLDGNLFTEFSLPATVGAVVGLADGYISVDPRAIGHAFYVYQQGGAEYWRVIESGALRTAAVPRTDLNALFRIERRGLQVDYFYDNIRVYRSAVSAPGPRIVVASLYAADDGVN